MKELALTAFTLHDPYRNFVLNARQMMSQIRSRVEYLS